MFARRKKTAFKGPHLNAGLFSHQSGPALGSPALFARNREGSDHTASRLFSRNKRSAGSAGSAGASAGGSLAIPEEPHTPGKRKSVIVEEDEEEEAAAEEAATAGKGNAIVQEEDEEEEYDGEPIEEVDAFDDPVLFRGERLDSITYMNDPPVLKITKRDGSGSKERPHMTERLPSQVLFSPGQTPVAGTPTTEKDSGFRTPKISAERERLVPGAASPGERSIQLGESATTPRVDVGGWSR